MALHHTSAHREDSLRHAAAVEEGVCLALDVLLELGEGEAAAKAFAALFVPRDGKATLATPKPQPPKLSQTLLDGEVGAPPKLNRASAQRQGYTGDACSNCGSLRMQVAGHCTVCADCGTTTGCS
jgi:hypothetical protein